MDTIADTDVISFREYCVVCNSNPTKFIYFNRKMWFEMRRRERKKKKKKWLSTNKRQRNRFNFRNFFFLLVLLHIPFQISYCFTKVINVFVLFVQHYLDWITSLCFFYSFIFVVVVSFSDDSKRHHQSFCQHPYPHMHKSKNLHTTANLLQ